MQAVVTPLSVAFLREMMPGIKSRGFHIRILELIAFREEKGIRRIVAVPKALAPTFKHVMLPCVHAMPAAFRINEPVARLEKAGAAVSGQATDQVSGIKGKFHLLHLDKLHQRVSLGYGT